MRLDKYISQCTQLARKQSRLAIKNGYVTVNKNLIIDQGFQVKNNDTVELEDETLILPGPRYFMFHKPAGVICANSDPHLPCVLDYFSQEKDGLNIAGRLDKDTTGLLLISDDGQWIHKVTSPNYPCPKVYIADIDSPLTASTIISFAEGILLKGEDKPTRSATVSTLENLKVKIILNEGRYHQVKRMFAACGHHVINLHRQQIGAIELDEHLAPGELRQLNSNEIASVG